MTRRRRTTPKILKIPAATRILSRGPTTLMPTTLRDYDKVAQQCAAEDVDYPRFLLRSAELELLDRERRATERRVRQAKFPVLKSLDSFGFLAIPSLNKA